MKISNTTITQNDVKSYREIYYSHVKPMILSKKTDKEIDDRIDFIAESYGTSYDRFRILYEIDMLQRIAKVIRRNLNKKIIVNSSNFEVIPNKEILEVLNLPELRDPERSDDKEPM